MRQQEKPNNLLITRKQFLRLAGAAGAMACTGNWAYGIGTQNSASCGMQDATSLGSLVGDWGRVNGQNLFLVAVGEKPGCRMQLYPDDISSLAVTASKLSLHLVLQEQDSIVEGQDDEDLSRSGKREILAYLAREQNLATRLRNLEFEHKAEALGQALGYPPCCARSFGGMFSPERFLNYARISWYSNVFLLRYDYGLLNHLPCRPSCPASLDLAYRYYRRLFSHSPGLATQIAVALASWVVVSPKSGVFAFKASERLGGLVLHEVVAGSSDLFLRHQPQADEDFWPTHRLSPWEERIMRFC